MKLLAEQDDYDFYVRYGPVNDIVSFIYIPNIQNGDYIYWGIPKYYGNGITRWTCEKVPFEFLESDLKIFVDCIDRFHVFICKKGSDIELSIDERNSLIFYLKMKYSL